MTEIGLSIDAIDTPFLWVDLDALESNVASLAEYFRRAGVDWRPHTKGIKIPEVAKLAVFSGAIGVTCAKLDEACIMADAGIEDILIANQVVGQLKARRLAQLSRRVKVAVAVDNAENLAELSAAAVEADTTINVVIEVDTGMERAGVKPGEAAVALSRQAAAAPGLRYRGLMGWEGHTRNVLDLEERRPLIEASVQQLVETAQMCREAGLPVEIVSAGGTGTYYVTAHVPGVTEIQAGGAIFGDNWSQLRHVDTLPALRVRAQVTSHPDPDRIIVDAGFKAMPAWHASPQPLGLAGVASIKPSAEHCTIKLETPQAEIRIGRKLDFLPGYEDENICLYDQLYGIRHGKVEVIWQIAARGKLR